MNLFYYKWALVWGPFTVGLAALAALLALAGAPARADGGLLGSFDVRLSLAGDAVAAGEPLLLNYTIRNKSSRQGYVTFGPGRKEWLWLRLKDAAGRTLGAEALVRWRHPVRGMVAPGEFIGLAEQTGLILPLGQWVVQSACAQLAAWAHDAATHGLVLSVNVSARQFRQPEFATQVLAALQHSGASARLLRLELTESLLLTDTEEMIAKMEFLRAQGVGFSLDDFGTGYSSLSYLKRLPLGQLKIDRGFVRDVLTDPNDAAIVRTILALAQSLDLNVVAEGVETPGQLDFLQRHGCTAFQGYLFGRPGPAQWIGRPAAAVS